MSEHGFNRPMPLPADWLRRPLLGRYTEREVQQHLTRLWRNICDNAALANRPVHIVSPIVSPTTEESTMARDMGIRSGMVGQAVPRGVDQQDAGRLANIGAALNESHSMASDLAFRLESLATRLLGQRPPDNDGANKELVEVLPAVDSLAVKVGSVTTCLRFALDSLGRLESL